MLGRILQPRKLHALPLLELIISYQGTSCFSCPTLNLWKLTKLNFNTLKNKQLRLCLSCFLISLSSPNLPAPINVSSTEQTKTGNLIIEGVLILGQFTTANAPLGTEGALYFDTTEKKTKVYSSAAWADLGGGAEPGQLPTYTTAERDAIVSPDYGLMVYNTDSYRVEYYLPDVWAAIQAPFAGGHSCTAAIDCASEICVDGYCCNTLCTGNCNRCNIAGSLGTCTDAASDCTGNCDICSSGNCAAVAATCTGNCSTCSGSGTTYNCAAVEATCTGNCDTCSGSGTAYSCAANATLCTTACVGVCSGSGTVYNCAISGSIGTSCGGGKIAYIDGTGIHGFIAALSNQSTGTTWGCYGTAISGADGTAIGTGHQNTHDMIAAGCTNAAQLTHGVTINGYADWYLPSKDELSQLYVNQTAIGGFVANIYWSSSECTADTAWIQIINGTSQYPYCSTRSNSLLVRAIRDF